MKTLKFFLSTTLVVALSFGLNAQNKVVTKTETIKVSGKCEMCESTIEKAAKVDGVTKADWNKKTKVLTLVYNPTKVENDDVQKKIAAVGYDTPKYKATAKSYNALPGCCKYR